MDLKYKSKFERHLQTAKHVAHAGVFLRHHPGDRPSVQPQEWEDHLLADNLVTEQDELHVSTQ